jgi:hypothetical protein
MKNKSLLLIVFTFMVACTSTPPLLRKQEVKPFHDPDTYAKGNWALLAQSISKNWYYDPDSLKKLDDGIVSFWSYSMPNSSAGKQITKSPPYSENLEFEPANLQNDLNQSNENPFHPLIYGPYLQKIDCVSHYHSSESLIDGSCDLSEASPQAQNSIAKDPIECWRKIKSKTAIAFIENRVCGRKLPMESARNFFLFQEDSSHSSNRGSRLMNSEVKFGESVVAGSYFEVIGNEYKVIDTKGDIRQMRVASYLLDKNLTNIGYYLYQARCSEKTGSLTKAGSGASMMKPIGNKTSFSGVAFNRICANHGDYMNLVKNFPN